MSEKRGTIESQTKTTRRLDEAFKQSAEREMADGEKRPTSHKRAGKRPAIEQAARPSEQKPSKKALARWEGEGGALLPKKKGGKK